MSVIGDFFNFFLINPLTNLFVLLAVLTGNAGIAVILLTIIIRIVTLPLTLRQMHGTRMMGLLAPRIQELQKRYKDPKRRSEEQMRMYREAGINPLGCFSSMLLQMPIMIALYQVFRVAVGETPESLIKVSGRLYDWDFLRSGFPLPSEFLWLNLGQTGSLELAVFVGATMYVQQKMMAMPAADERARAQMSMMNTMMPLIFGWITFTLASALGIYFAMTNVIGMVMQYAYVGGGPFNWRSLIGLSQEPVLPKALEAREAQQASFSQMSREDESEAESKTDGARYTRKSSRQGEATDAGRRRKGGRQTSAARRRRRRSSP